MRMPPIPPPLTPATALPKSSTPPAAPSPPPTTALTASLPKPPPQGSVSYGYDAASRRTRPTVAGQPAITCFYDKTIATATTSYLYDGPNPVQELNGTTPTANLITGLNIDEYFRRTDSLGPRDFLTDALGSTLALADSTGIIQTSYTYAPYGNTITTGQANSNPFQYTGRENDGTGLYYYRARYYDPVRQRFVSEDPIGLAGGLNTYLYAEANPLLYTDPLGLFSASDLPNIPQPIVDTVTGFGDAFLISELVRDALDIDGGVNKCSAAYRGGKIGGSITGGVPFALRGAAAAGATRAGHWLNHGQYWRIGPGRMPSAGPGLPGGGQVPRMTIGRDVAGSNRPHADLRSRIPYAPPIGGPTTSDDCSSR